MPTPFLEPAVSERWVDVGVCAILNYLISYRNCRWICNIGSVVTWGDRTMGGSPPKIVANQLKRGVKQVVGNKFSFAAITRCVR